MFSQDEILEINNAIEESSEDSTIYLGADSKVYSEKGIAMVAYVVVVIVHYNSSKGAKVFDLHRTERYYGGIRQRLMSEVTDIITVGNQIHESIGDRDFEVHLDINTNKKYKSSMIVKEATGYVMGTLGIEPKLKPNAFAASSVADKYAVSDARRKMDSPAQKRKHRRQLKRVV